MRISDWSSDVCSSDLKDLLFTSVHEVWPGHFLNFLHSNRATSIFGKLFVGYAFAEGWAHYTEAMMWEAGLGEGDLETHIGQLDRKSVVEGKSVSVRVDLGGRRILKKKNKKERHNDEKQRR